MSNYTIDNLNNVDFFTELNKQVNKIEFHNDTNEALRVLRGLQKAIRENEQKINSDLIDGYKEMITKLRFVLFLNQSDNEVSELFKECLVIGIKMIYVDLLESLKTKISFIALPDRDEYKKQIIKIILNNQEEISSKSIKAGEERARPTVSNWLKDYNRYLGTGPKNNLEQSKYFIKNENFVILDKLGKLELKELFSIYEYLKRSSGTLEGNEDNMIIKDIDGKTYILQNNRFLEIKSKTEITHSEKLGLSKAQPEKKIDESVAPASQASQHPADSLEKKAIQEEREEEDKIDELVKLVNQYPEGSLERKAIKEEIEKLKI